MLPARYRRDAETWDCECGETNLQPEPTCRYCGALKPDSRGARMIRETEREREPEGPCE